MPLAAIPKSKAKTAYALLSEVRRLILKEPKRYNQNWWKTRKGEQVTADAPLGFPKCGTVGCVAGWVVTLKRGHRVDIYDIPDTAQGILGINETQRGELFRYSAAIGPPQTEEHARSGADHVQRFQQTHAKQLKAKRV